MTDFDTDGYKSSNNYIGLGNEQVANKLAERTIDNAVPYLRPVLDALPPDFKLLDVGCGPGSITINIAKDYPNCRIWGLDEPGALALAKRNIEAAGVKNITLVAGDALDIQSAALDANGKPKPGLELLNAGFDVVHTHQVHMHVRDAPKLMRELRATVKPKGGTVCCRESDMGMVAAYPDNSPVINIVSKMMPQIMTARGQDPYVGRKLVSHALKAGFKRDDITASVGPWVYSTPKERREMASLFTTSLHQEKTASQMQEWMDAHGEGLTVQDMLKMWDEWVAAEDGWCCMLNSQVVCRRSD